MTDVERAVLYHTIIRVPNGDEIKAWTLLQKKIII